MRRTLLFIMSLLLLTGMQMRAEVTPNITAFDLDSDVREYVIDSQEGLAKLAEIVNDGNPLGDYTFTMMSDIELKDEDDGMDAEKGWTPIGDGEADHPFSGTFNGNGHKITGLWIYNAAQTWIGLFGYTEGTIENLGVVIDNEAGGIVAKQKVGGLVGDCQNATISKCYVSGQVSGTTDVGLLVGICTKTIISDCYTVGSVIGAQSAIGGLVGEGSCVITNCYTACAISANRWGSGIGGYIHKSGEFSSSINNCVVISPDITGASSTNRIVGTIGEATTLSNNYAWVANIPNPTNNNTFEAEGLNGADWSGDMDEQPINGWNDVNSDTWTIDNKGEFMPKLAVFGNNQPAIANVRWMEPGDAVNLPLEENFDSDSYKAWTMSDGLALSTDEYFNALNSLEFTEAGQYLISPKLPVTKDVKKFLYYSRTPGDQNKNILQYGYSTSNRKMESFIWIDNLDATEGWNSGITLSIPAEAIYIAFRYLATGGSTYIDHIVITGDPVEDGGEETPGTATTYTINLEVAEGIDIAGLTAGNHTVSEGDHLFLQFLPEDRTLGADDVLFLIDGIETTFTASDAGNYFSYILNPVEADHTILIALKEYPVTLPEVEGIIYNVGAGTHLVPYGEKFTFTLTLADGIDPEKVHVFANGIEIQPDALRATILTYTIDKVITSITVLIEGAGDGTTGNIDIASGKINIAIDNGQLTIDNGTANAIDAAVYTVTGQTFVQLRGLRGSKTLTLPAGIYLVKAGKKTWKIIVN